MKQSMVSIIAKKRDGEELTESEIQYFISGTVNGTITDTQIGEFALDISKMNS